MNRSTLLPLVTFGLGLIVGILWAPTPQFDKYHTEELRLLRELVKTYEDERDEIRRAIGKQGVGSLDAN